MSFSNAVAGAGDTWTWTALDSHSKLIISWLVGGRDGEYALAFMDDVKDRLANRVQLTTDGHKAYLNAVEEAFGADLDYAMLVKPYGEPESNRVPERRYSPAVCTGAKKTRIEGSPDPEHVSTSRVERQNLTMRMHMRGSFALRMGSQRSSRTTFTWSRSTRSGITSSAFTQRCVCRPRSPPV